MCVCLCVFIWAEEAFANVSPLLFLRYKELKSFPLSRRIFHSKVTYKLNPPGIRTQEGGMLRALG